MTPVQVVAQLAERAWRFQRAVQTYRAENPDLLDYLINDDLPVLP